MTIGTEAVDRDGKKWHGEATFTSDDHGTVDLDKAKPSGGSYPDVDGMGLFWSMNPPDGDRSPWPRTSSPGCRQGWAKTLALLGSLS